MFYKFPCHKRNIVVTDVDAVRRSNGKLKNTAFFKESGGSHTVSCDALLVLGSRFRDVDLHAYAHLSCQSADVSCAPFHVGVLGVKRHIDLDPAA